MTDRYLLQLQNQCSQPVGDHVILYLTPVLSNVEEEQREAQKGQVSVLKPETEIRRGKVANSQVEL